MSGVGREGHGRVTARPKDLCSYCLCDEVKKNVYCQHEHTNHVSIEQWLLCYSRLMLIQITVIDKGLVD